MRSKHLYLKRLSKIKCVLLIILITPLTVTAAECNIRSQKISIDNLPIAYNSAGENSSIETKPTLLLLHGLFASKKQWEALICQLAEAYNVIAPDLPGHGESQGYAVTDYQLEKQAAILHQFIDALAITELHIAGSSMGGAIAALFARNYPDQTLTLAFLGSPLGIVPYNEPVKATIYQGINPFIPISPQEFEIEMALLFNFLPQIPAEIIAEKVADYIANNKHYVQVWNIVNLYINVLQRQFTIDKPVFIAWGENDQIFNINPGKEKLANTFTRSTAVTIEQAGHLPQSDNPDELAAQYLQFLSLQQG